MTKIKWTSLCMLIAVGTITLFHLTLFLFGYDRLYHFEWTVVGLLIILLLK